MMKLQHCRSVALALTFLIIPLFASAQSQCMDCGPGNDCATTCRNGGTPSTCGEWGVCYEMYHYCGYICSGGQVACDTYCYAGEWPNGENSSCQAAGYPCDPGGCEPNYQEVTYDLSQWQEIRWEGYPSVPVCYLYVTKQHVYEDLEDCEESNPPEYRDCWAQFINVFMNTTNCCNNWPYWQCSGDPWPASCR